jgi:hypothetical protein
MLNFMILSILFIVHLKFVKAHYEVNPAYNYDCIPEKFYQFNNIEQFLILKSSVAVTAKYLGETQASSQYQISHVVKNTEKKTLKRGDKISVKNHFKCFKNSQIDLSSHLLLSLFEDEFGNLVYQHLPVENAPLKKIKQIKNLDEKNKKCDYEILEPSSFKFGPKGNEMKDFEELKIHNGQAVDIRIGWKSPKVDDDCKNSLFRKPLFRLIGAESQQKTVSENMRELNIRFSNYNQWSAMSNHYVPRLHYSPRLSVSGNE